MARTLTFFGAVAALLISITAQGAAPSRPMETFGKAKQVARDKIYDKHRTDLYCGCDYAKNKAGSGGKIDPTRCGYVARKNKSRGKVLEWEHIMPAYFFGHQRPCWSRGASQCVKKSGERFKGRACCARADRAFRRAEGDLHNLAPAVGELNGDRSNLPYGLVAEAGQYGRCDFRIGGEPRVCEPGTVIKGDVARVWFYMADVYKVKIAAADRRMFESWSARDPVDKWERERNKLIAKEQGNTNPYVK
jgi:deoxyribonuclease-1